MRLEALSERPFRQLWLGRTASTFGDALVPVATAFAVLRIGGGASGIGYVLGAFTLSQVAFLLVGGVWADRLPRRLVMLSCDAIRAIVQSLVAVALLTGEARLWMLVASGVVFGAASAFFMPASAGLLPQTVSIERLQEANGLIWASQSGVRIFAPALSGVLVAVAQPGWVFAIDAATFVVSAAFLARLRIEPTPPVRQRFFAELGEGFRAVRARSWLVAGLAAVAFLNLGTAATAVLGPVVAANELGGAGSWGAIAAAGGVGALLGALAAMRLTPRRPFVLCFGLWVLGMAMPLALLPPLPAAAVALASLVWGFGSTCGNTVWETAMQREIPDELRSRVYSFDMLVSVCFLPLGQFVAGPLAAIVGIEATLAVGAILLAVPSAIALTLPSVRSLQHAPRAA